MVKIPHGLKRVFALALILALALGMTNAALAAEEPFAPDEPVFEPEPVPEAAAPEPVPAPQAPAAPEVPAAPETAQPDPTEPPVVVTPEPPVPEEAQEELQEPEDEPETAQAGGHDPEDPVYDKMMAGQASLASVTTESFDDYVPRQLKTGETLRLGVDVSAYQGANIDWNQVAASGVEFAIVRVAYRTTGSGELKSDSCFARNLAGARAAGLKVGAYIFSQALTEEEAREEAQYLMKLVKGYHIDLPLVFDYEEVTGSSRRLKMYELERQLKTDIANAFCSEVEKYGYQSMVYSNPSMLSKDLYREQLGRLWLAHFTKQTSYAGAYEYWQCGYGKVDGIADTVDMDFWFDQGGKLTPPAQQEQKPTPTPKPTATPTPTPEPAPEVKNPFGDVASSSWYYADVMAAYGAGIVKGQTETSFGPNATASRGQVVTMLYRLEGSPAAPVAAAFTDLTQEYYRDAVNWAAANKVVSGTSDTTFSPNSSITREQLAAMLYRLAGSPSVNGSLSKFSDGPSVQSYARDAMVWAVDRGIVKGNSDGTLKPASSATRAEVCAMLMRYDKL